MFDKLYGMIRRTNYFVAILITLLGIILFVNESYSWYKEPKLQSWKFVDTPTPGTEYRLLTNDKHAVIVEFRSQSEIVTAEITDKIKNLTKVEQDKRITQLAEEIVWPKKDHHWDDRVYMLFLPLLIAFLLHRVTVWIIWGKLK